MTLEQLQQAYAELEQTHQTTCNELQATKNKLAKTSLVAEKYKQLKKDVDVLMAYVDEIAGEREGDTIKLLLAMRNTLEELSWNKDEQRSVLFTLIDVAMENASLQYDGLEHISTWNFDELDRLRKLTNSRRGY